MATPTELYEQALALHRAGDLASAARQYDAVLRTDGRNAAALHMRGVVHLQQQEFEQAVALIRKAVALDPADAAAYGNLSSALMALRHTDEAIEAARKGVALNPQAAEIWGNLGASLTRRSRYPEAIDAYRQAVALQPERPGLHSAIGYCLGKLERFGEALESHRRAIRLAPDKPQYRNNMSVTLRAMKLDAEAEDMLRSAIEDGLDDVELRGSFASLLHERGKFDEALQIYRSARDEGLDSTTLDDMMLFYQNHRFEATPEKAKADALDWARRSATGVKPYASYRNSRHRDRPLRVGLVSGDFREHPVGRFLKAPMAQLDPAAVTLYAYSALDNDDETNCHLRGIIPNWRSTAGYSDEEVAARIHNDQIDVLVDLSGHTARNRLRVFMYRPAPISVTWLGYFATTGIEAIDYVLCNQWLLPPEEEHQWVEKPWHLPSAHWCYDAMPAEWPVAPSPALATGYVTFGCYNNFEKLNGDTIATWVRILDAVPDSRLLLRSSNLKKHVRRAVVDEFARHGYAEGDRLTIEAASMPYAQHMQSYGLLDVALDPFPYNGGTTTVEALYMGVPVLTLHGDRFVAHMAESNIRSAGLDEWVAHDVDDYVRRAAGLTVDISRLANLRSSIREQVMKSRLFDAASFARDLEAAFTGMWAAWLDAEQTRAARGS